MKVLEPADAVELMGDSAINEFIRDSFALPPAP